jgi:hypothetical protein
MRRDHGFGWSYTWVKTQLHTAGLVERGLGKPSPKRVPAAERERMLDLYRGARCALRSPPTPRRNGSRLRP